MQIIKYGLGLILLVLVVLCFWVQTDLNKESPNAIIFFDSMVEKVIPKPKKTSFLLTDFYSEHPDLLEKVDSIYAQLPLVNKIGQLLIVGLDKKYYTESSIIQLIKAGKIGGVHFLGGTKKKYEVLVDTFDNNNIDTLYAPLVFSLDAEPSLINNRIKKGIPTFPKTNKLITADTAQQVATGIAKVLKERGIHINFAPVCDYSNNKAIIGNRAFGNTYETVSERATAFIQAAQQENIMASAKHFPGHGNVKGDSHKKLVTIYGDFQELGVFKDAIAAQVISVMVGHINVDNATFNTKGKPATLSKNIVTTLLKDSLQFKGLAITDAMDMGALSNFKDATTKAFIAGNDIILMPTDVEKFHQDVTKLVQTDSLLQLQFTESVKKVLQLKVCLGLFNQTSQDTLCNTNKSEYKTKNFIK